MLVFGLLCLNSWNFTLKIVQYSDYCFGIIILEQEWRYIQESSRLIFLNWVTFFLVSIFWLFWAIDWKVVRYWWVISAYFTCFLMPIKEPFFWDSIFSFRFSFTGFVFIIVPFDFFPSVFRCITWLWKKFTRFFYL